MLFVYDEAENLQESISGLQRIPISPARIVLNPAQRAGFLPVLIEPIDQFLQLQSFSY